MIIRPARAALGEKVSRSPTTPHRIVAVPISGISVTILDLRTIFFAPEGIERCNLNVHMGTSTPTRRREPVDTRVTAKLIGNIKRLISSGTIVPGAKFPPERELAKEFGVNRASLRQALKVLEIMGVLTQRVGDGTYLSASAESILKEPLDFLILLDDLSHHELMETRMIVEPELAARAAERATTEDFVSLRRAIAAMENCRTNQERLEADLAFHQCIFRASGNRICHLLFNVIHRSVLTSMSQLSTRVPLDRPLTFHKRIFAAIQQRNSEEARRQMLEHIADTQALLASNRK